ncbi:MAG: glycosyltransferase [Nitrospirae bacterium]|nr:glycosyltransferase [Nitrospirota bacterium]
MTKKKILYLASRYPYPPVSGGLIRMYNISKMLAQHFITDIFSLTEHDISKEHLDTYKKHLATVESGINHFNNVYVYRHTKYASYVNTLKSLIDRRPLQVAYYYFRDAQRKINDLIKQNKYDLIFCSHIRTTDYAAHVDIPRVVDCVDSMSLSYLQDNSLGSNFLWKRIYAIEKGRVPLYEKRLPGRFGYCFLTSDNDSEYLKKLSGQTNIVTISNGVGQNIIDYGVRSSNAHQMNTLTFLGKMDYKPNIDAVVYFVKKIWPMIKETLGDVEFQIIGSKPTAEVQALLASKGVVVTGFVNDPYEAIVSSKMFIAPMISGSGIKNKILEAMALGKCVVTTSSGAGGIEGVDDQHFVIADEPEQFATKVIDLWSDAPKRQRIGADARALVMERYVWEKTTKELINILNQMV